MTNPAINLLALGLYVIAGWLLWRRLARARPATGGTRIGILTLGFAAAVLHAVVLYGSLRAEGGINLPISVAFSLIAWAVAVVFLVTALYKPIENLGIVVLPVAALTILIKWLWPGEPLVREASTIQSAHIFIAILAYSLFCLAAVQSLLLLLQEHKLRQRHPGGFVRALPPVQTMESLLFQMIGVGFLLLTATLISGIFFSEQVFGQPLRLTHHIVLSVIAWGVFGVLLAGHWFYGWRGQTAIRWTLAGFALLLLAYFGAKFVLEVVLGRAG